jgi:polysaccharide chain length determinant protein (PEP-CTERM system associated)
MQQQDVQKYLDIAKRRRYWAIIPSMVLLLCGMAYALFAPKIYEAKTLILVETQRVPTNFVRPIVSSGMEDKLRTITEQVTSRTNLDAIIKEYGLYNDAAGSRMILDEKIDLCRKSIGITVARGGAFAISFRGPDPRKVTQVANALASNFISENLKIRESQVLGTSTFLADELESVRKQLLEKEEALKNYREKYMGGLPDQLQTNLYILQRLQSQLGNVTTGIRDAENRKILIQAQMAEPRSSGGSPESGVPRSSGDQRQADLDSLRKELAVLESKYTQNHPDVIRVKEMISRLEQKNKKPEGQVDRTQNATALPNVASVLKRQYLDVDIEIKNLKIEQERLSSRIKLYQKKVEETPIREQELIDINRDYGNLKETYSSLLKRKLEAEIAASMEKKQKGEQFRILDPAKEPEKPVKPDVPLILLMTLALALGVGGGIAYLREMMDTSFKAPDEVEKGLDMRILVSIPFRYTEQQSKRRKIREILKATSLGVGFAVGAVAIVVASNSVGRILHYLRSFFGIFGIT